MATHHSCSEYILCYEGTPITQSCADGLEFDPVMLQCVLYKDSTCEILNCPEESEIPVFLPNKRDCESYYICVKGSPVAQSCAKGLHWNANDEQCQHPTSAKCVSPRDMEFWIFFSYSQSFNRSQRKRKCKKLPWFHRPHQQLSALHAHSSASNSCQAQLNVNIISDATMASHTCSNVQLVQLSTKKLKLAYWELSSKDANSGCKRNVWLEKIRPNYIFIPQLPTFNVKQ